MAKHLKQDIYKDLHQRLVNLFPGTPNTISLEVLANGAQLDIGKIDFRGDGYTVWDRILSRAEHEEEIDKLLISAQRFNNNDPLVNETLVKVQSGEAYIQTAVVDHQKSGLVHEGGKVRVFINYDEADEQCKIRLMKMLKVLARFPDPFPVTFFDVLTDTTAGAIRDKLIKEEIERSDIVMLFLSTDFLSGSGYDITLMAAELKKHFVPIIVQPSPIERIKLIAPLQMLPRDDKPLANRDDAVYKSVATEIFKLIEIIHKQIA